MYFWIFYDTHVITLGFLRSTTSNEGTVHFNHSKQSKIVSTLVTLIQKQKLINNN